jgi:hypothetical protein
MMSLIWKSHSKVTKNPTHHVIFMNFGVKNFTVRNEPKKKTLMFHRYSLLDPMD